MQNTPIIRVKKLYKIYRLGEERVRALNGVTFDINAGEFVAIVGASGSGKSTLLNMLAGLESPTKGEIIIANEHIEKKTENQLVAFRRKHVGFVFQSYNLLPNMTAVENVALPLSFRGESKRSRIKKAQTMLRLVGMADRMKHRPTQMSGGQQQRVGIARALVVEPEIVFADEPTGNLDSKTSEEMMALMRKVVSERHQTLVMVTHDDHLAQYADKVIRIMDGSILNIIVRNRETGEETVLEEYKPEIKNEPFIGDDEKPEKKGENPVGEENKPEKKSENPARDDDKPEKKSELPAGDDDKPVKKSEEDKIDQDKGED